jgi:hypothetical protein
VNAVIKKTAHEQSFQSNYRRLQMGLEVIFGYVILGLVVILVGWNRVFVCVD